MEHGQRQYHDLAFPMFVSNFMCSWDSSNLHSLTMKSPIHPQIFKKIPDDREARLRNRYFAFEGLQHIVSRSSRSRHLNKESVSMPALVVVECKSPHLLKPNKRER